MSTDSGAVPEGPSVTTFTVWAPYAAGGGGAWSSSGHLGSP